MTVFRFLVQRIVHYVSSVRACVVITNIRQQGEIEYATMAHFHIRELFDPAQPRLTIVEEAASNMPSFEHVQGDSNGTVGTQDLPALRYGSQSPGLLIFRKISNESFLVQFNLTAWAWYRNLGLGVTVSHRASVEFHRGIGSG